MNERSPLLKPDESAASFVVHTVAHDASAQMGMCCMNDGVKTDVLCEICNKWICRAHQGYHQSNREPFDDVTYIPCVSQRSVGQHRISPVCPDCQRYEERPPGYPHFYVNKTGKVSAVLCVLLIVIVVIAMLAK